MPGFPAKYHAIVSSLEAHRGINGDLRIRASEQSSQIEWSASPSGKVWRKRLHLVGAAESGQVTSLVRYEAGSEFPAHDHPEGEEILVLDGVFSDEHGDWPAGTYLLNPEGFRHAPFSREGCLLFVKLRQFPGRDREHVVLQTQEIPWANSEDGIQVRPLYQQAGFSDVTRLERWDPKTERGVASYPQGAEIFVLEGEFEDEDGLWKAASWLRLPIGAKHRPRSASGCTLYKKSGGLAYLRQSEGTVAETGGHPTALPSSLGSKTPYSKTAVFDENTFPAALQARHDLKAGTWAKLHVVEGRIHFVYLEPKVERRTLASGEVQIVPPQVPHRVELDGPVRLFLEFYK